ncbi:hypothetical protein EW14_1734 [Prochlorococcus sp. MIT 0604]|nr:hypothetical protein EW14_1734 [Prochlorococcus sp. MIT 0604]
MANEKYIRLSITAISRVGDFLSKLYPNFLLFDEPLFSNFSSN